MLGLLVENRYDGVLKRQQGILHSTKHDGMGIGLVSIQTAVSRYGGSMTVETENGLFRVNILLNLLTLRSHLRRATSLSRGG